jgi:hypothetical protein
MKSFYLKVLTGIFILVIGCSGSTDKPSDKLIETGEYEFTMKDSTGAITARGILSIDSFKVNKVTGTYRFTEMVYIFNGQETMTGVFSGRVNENSKTVLINTNPAVADNNVFFNLNIKNGLLDGEWYYSAFRQTFKPGKIKLVKK